MIKACAIDLEGRGSNPGEDQNCYRQNLSSGGLTPTVIPCIWEEYTNADPPPPISNRNAVEKKNLPYIVQILLESHCKKYHSETLALSVETLLKKYP